MYTPHNDAFFSSSLSDACLSKYSLKCLNKRTATAATAPHVCSSDPNGNSQNVTPKFEEKSSSLAPPLAELRLKRPGVVQHAGADCSVQAVQLIAERQRERERAAVAAFLLRAAMLADLLSMPPLQGPTDEEEGSNELTRQNGVRGLVILASPVSAPLRQHGHHKSVSWDSNVDVEEREGPRPRRPPRSPPSRRPAELDSSSDDCADAAFACSSEAVSPSEGDSPARLRHAGIAAGTPVNVSGWGRPVSVPDVSDLSSFPPLTMGSEGVLA
eukprot:9744-Heterococcus_DN1.PRE.1